MNNRKRFVISSSPEDYFLSSATAESALGAFLSALGPFLRSFSAFLTGGSRGRRRRCG